MHTRRISRETCDLTLAQLTDVKRTPGRITGRHEAHGLTILTRDGDDYLAEVEEPSYIDAIAGDEVGARMARAMR